MTSSAWVSGNAMLNKLNYIDLFCGVGGFRYAVEEALSANSMLGDCVFSSDVDKDCQIVYAKNFGERPFGDITTLDPSQIKDFDLLLAGFPCQPFSIFGKGHGFDDTRGTLFFSIARILGEKKPKAFVLENVKQLKGHDGGKTLQRIMDVIRELGYYADFHVYNAINFGLPQQRERIFIVGFKDALPFQWPAGGLPMKALESILEKNVDPFYDVSEAIKKKRILQISKTNNIPTPGIWHENKSGHVSVYPYSCALRAGSSYNYLLVDGKRRLTGREMFRLQGFPEKFQLAEAYTVARRQAGNSLPVPIASAILKNLLRSMKSGTRCEYFSDENGQLFFSVEGEKTYDRQ